MMDTFPDLGSLSDQELKDLIQQLTDEEQEVSYRRRILHGKIDILRAELVNRLRKKHEGGEDVISGADVQRLTEDRKSTRLNSSHANISYAVFCLKKKTYPYTDILASRRAEQHTHDI